LWEQLTSHPGVDSLKNDLAALVIVVKATSIRGTIFNREMLAPARDSLPYVGYGICSGKNLPWGIRA